MRESRHRLSTLLVLLLPCSLSAAPGDADNDGLRDAVETNTGIYVSASNTGTNPNLADSDGDSLPDGMEVNLGTNPTSAASKIKRPNIIFIMADDLAYGDLGCFWQNQRTGTWKFSTPNLDTMASQGAMLTHHYSAGSVCGPTRASFLLGQHQGHALKHSGFDNPLPDNHNVAGMLQRAGYRTIHVGKAGLAGTNINPLISSASLPAHPLKRGFDRFFGYLRHDDGHEHYPRNGTATNLAVIHDDYRPVTDAYQDLFTGDAWTAFAKKSIIEETQQHPDRPFFLYLAYDTPHFYGCTSPTKTYPAGKGVSGGIQWLGAPAYASTAINDPNRVNNLANADPSCDPSWYWLAKYYVSMIKRLDDSVADLLQTLQDLHIADNTLVVFTSDNGSSDKECGAAVFQSSAGFEGAKFDLWEGGIRAPTIAWWPQNITATNNPSNIRKITLPSVGYDWMPTFAELAKVPAPATTDGVSLLPTLTGQGQQRNRECLFFDQFYGGFTSRYPDFPNHGGETRGYMQAIRIGDLMGVRTNIQTATDRFRIYDVVNDPKQAVDLAGAYPELQQNMQRIAVGSRSRAAGAARPYDNAQIPGALAAPIRSGIACKTYEGHWPYLPDFEHMTPDGTLDAVQVSSQYLSRAEDAGLSFEGYLSVTTAGTYTFEVTSSGPTSLWLHNGLAIDNDVSFTSTRTSSALNLAAGLHPIRLNFRHIQGAATLELKYSGPGFTMRAVPASALFMDGRPTLLAPDVAQTRSATQVNIDVLANDSAENPLQLQSTSPPRNGNASILNGKVVYTPNPGFIGTDQFSYTVFDGVRNASSNVTVKVLYDDEIWIPLDEGGGTSVTAYSSVAPLPGTLAGAIDPSGAWVGGRLGKALLFDGADARVEFPDLQLPSGNAPRSFSCWLKTENTSLSESQTLFTYGQGTDEQRFTIRLDRGPSSPNSLVVAVESLPGRIMGGKPINDGVWHHLVVVHGGANISEVKLYVDGQPDLPSSVNPGIPATASGSSSILGGRNDSATGNFKGTLDDVRLFSRALTPEEAGSLNSTSLANVVFDSDGDGFTDMEEETAGTNPDDRNSFLKLETVVDSDGKVTLRWAGVAGRTYVIEESTNLELWMPVEGLAPLVINAAMPNATVTLASNGNVQRFFRLKVSLTSPSGPDQDNDGFPDGAEIMAGTDPNDPSSFFRINSMTWSQNGVTLRWGGKAGRRYRVEESSNLFQWTRVPNLPAVDAAEPMPDASILVPANGAPKRFLRMQVELMQ